MVRWIRFLIAIALGLGFGLAYGWFLSPARSTGTSMDTLRIDYRTDVVLMIAEAYQNDQDLELAVRRLAIIGSNPPETMTEESIQFARKAGYTEPDISRIQSLLSALQTQPPPPGIPTP
jgi:hypothetical protein